MAKEKKSDSAKAPAAKKPAAAAAKSKTETAPAKKAEAKPAAKKPAAKTGGASQAPLIDTGLAAATAAAMVARRLGSGGGGAQSGAASQESASFKNLKESLNKPSAGNLGGILGTGAGQKKSASGFGPKQTGPGTGGGRNQTFGADVNRTGVPRRTSG